VGLFDEVHLERLVRLLDVPRTSVRASESRHHDRGPPERSSAPSSDRGSVRRRQRVRRGRGPRRHARSGLRELHRARRPRIHDDSPSGARRIRLVVERSRVDPVRAQSFGKRVIGALEQYALARHERVPLVERERAGVAGIERDDQERHERKPTRGPTGPARARATRPPASAMPPVACPARSRGTR
jgi:hypothetical protein